MAICYRIVRSQRPTLGEFMSYRALGKPLPDDADADLVDRWDAVSAYETEAQARTRALRVGGRFGRFIAAVEYDETTVRWQHTPGRRDGHLDIWCSPAVLLAGLRTVIPV